MRAQAEGLEFDPTSLGLMKHQPTAFRSWWSQYAPDPRGVLPSEVEAEIANPEASDLKVVTTETGDVITVIRIRKIKSLAKSSLEVEQNVVLKRRKKACDFSSLAKKAITQNILKQLDQDRMEDASTYHLPAFSYNPRYFNETSDQMSWALRDSQRKKTVRALKMISALKTLERQNARTHNIQRMKAKATESILTANTAMDSPQAYQDTLTEIRNKKTKIAKGARNLTSYYNLEMTSERANHRNKPTELFTKIQTSPNSAMSLKNWVQYMQTILEKDKENEAQLRSSLTKSIEKIVILKKVKNKKTAPNQPQSKSKNGKKAQVKPNAEKKIKTKNSGKGKKAALTQK